MGLAVEIASTLEFLLGHWAIDRVLEDRRDHRTVRFTGEAVVEPSTGGASYCEQGRVSAGTHTGPARRCLQFNARDDGTVAVDLEDGSPFIDLDLSSGRAATTHSCRADTYEMSFEVLGPDRMLERWRVSGPAKDYAAETVWRRGAPAPDAEQTR